MRRACIVVIGSLSATQGIAAKSTPAALAPPGTSELVVSAAAQGVQIYVCVKKDGISAWTLKAPDAELIDADGKPFAHHAAGPSWQARDGSKIVGTLVAKAASPDPGAIPWLLLSAKSAAPGVLAKVRFVQRIDTKGGVAPSGTCEPGKEIRVPYQATYTFFK